MLSCAIEIRKQSAQQIHYAQPGGITGHFMLLIMFLMYTTAHHKIRKQCFEVFWYTHHLAFFFMIGLFTHVSGCFVRDSIEPDLTSTFPYYSTDHCLGYYSWRFIIWPFIIYVGERVWREIRSRKTTQLSKVLIHPSGKLPLLDTFASHISPRCHGATHHKTWFKIYCRSVDIPSNPRGLPVSVAPSAFLSIPS